MFRPNTLIMALLILACAISACAQGDTHDLKCHTHKAGNGELTECE